MNKSELIDLVADHVGGKATAQAAVESIIEHIQRAVTAGETVRISGFGVFERQERAARTGRNPSTGAPVKIKKSAAPKFRPGTDFKAYVSGAKKYAKTGASTASGAVAVAKAVPSTAVKAAKAAGTAATKTTAAKVLGTASSTPVKKAAAKVLASTGTKTTAKAPAKTTAAKAPAKTAAKAPVKAAAKAPAAKATKAPAKKTTAKKTS